MTGRQIIQRSVIAAGLLLIASRAAALSPSSMIRTPGVATRPADHVIDTVDGKPIDDAVFSPDGKTIFALVQTPAVDVGDAMLSRGPVVITIALVAVILVCMGWAWRRWRRIAAREGRRCGRCGYTLTGAPGPACPECSAPFTARTRISYLLRRVAHRVGVPLACIALCVAGIVLLEARDLRPGGTVSQWLNWHSTALARWDSVWGLQWIKPYTYTDSALLLQVSPETGDVVRHVAFFHGHDPDFDPDKIPEELRDNRWRGVPNPWTFLTSTDPERAAVPTKDFPELPGTEGVIAIVDLRRGMVEQQVPTEYDRAWLTPRGLDGESSQGSSIGLWYPRERQLPVQMFAAGRTTHGTRALRIELVAYNSLDDGWHDSLFESSNYKPTLWKIEPMLPLDPALKERPEIDVMWVAVGKHRAVALLQDEILVVDVQRAEVVDRLATPVGFVAGESIQVQLSSDEQRLLVVSRSYQIAVYDDIGSRASTGAPGPSVGAR